jgi:hypothetical protein
MIEHIEDMLKNVESFLYDRHVMSSMGVQKIKVLHTLLKVVQSKLKELPDECEHYEDCGMAYSQGSAESYYDGRSDAYD